MNYEIMNNDGFIVGSEFLVSLYGTQRCIRRLHPSAGHRKMKMFIVTLKNQSKLQI